MKLPCHLFQPCSAHDTCLFLPFFKCSSSFVPCCTSVSMLRYALFKDFVNSWFCLKDSFNSIWVYVTGLKRTLKSLSYTKTEGIYYWRAHPNNNLPVASPQHINSIMHKLMMGGRLSCGRFGMHSL